jgi:hypothetical protein
VTVNKNIISIENNDVTSDVITFAALQLKLSTSPRWLKYILSKFVGYYNGEMNQFSVNDQGELSLSPIPIVSDNNSARQTLPIVIVARTYYRELVTTYPIDNKKELKKLLRLQFPNKHADDDLYSNITSHYHIWKAAEGKTPVNVWQFLTNVPTAFLQLPETLLFSSLVTHNQILCIDRGSFNNSAGSASESGENTNGSKENTTDALFVAKNSEAIHSLDKSTSINTTQLFAMAVGVAKTQTDKIINAVQFTSALVLGLQKTPTYMLASFIQWPATIDKVKWLKSIILPFTIVFTSYLALSSGYLGYKYQSLHTALESQGSDVDIALERQQGLDQQLARHKALDTFFSKQSNLSPFWLVFVDLMPQASFSNIRTEQGRIVLRGRAIKAIALLDLLSKHPLASNAKFDNPTRASNGTENFVISFELNNTVSKEFKAQAPEVKTLKNSEVSNAGA